MRSIVVLVLTLALLPSSLRAAILPETESAGPRPAPARHGDGPLTYVVITDRQLQGSFMPLVEARSRAGLPAGVVTLQEIESAYPSGVDLAERIRMFLKDAHANRGTQWVLLGGDASVVPMRRARLRPGVPGLAVIDLPTDQYYACLDGSWNADGDGFWGELPGPGEPGDDVDLIPELFVGRAPVGTAAEVSEFVRRTLAYEDRLAAAGSRSALLAADVINGLVDGAQLTEALRPLLEADPDRQIARLYENAASWPGSLPESRPALLDALAGGQDLAVLVGAGGPGVIVAGKDFCCDDYVTSDDLLGLTNAPHYPIVYTLSAFTTDPDPPLSIGAALMNARHGGAAAVIGSTDVQFTAIAGAFMRDFFSAAFGPDHPAIGEALARQITATNTQSFFGDLTRLTSQANLILGDPALHFDPNAPPVVARGAGRLVLPASAAKDGPVAAGATAAGAGVSLAIAGGDAASSAAAHPVAGARLRRDAAPAPVRLEAAAPGIAGAPVRLRFEFSGAAGGARYELAIFDLLGRRVRALAKGEPATGRTEIQWDLRSDAGAQVPGGIYLARLSIGGISRVSRVLVLR
jgi:peptidase C25-like protein